MKSDLFKWGILLGLGLIWGSSFILMKRGLEHFTFMEVGCLRLAFAFIFLLPFIITKAWKLPKKTIIISTLSGILGNGLPAILFTKAETGIDSSLAGILNSLTPLFTLIIGVLLFSTKTRKWNIVGLVLGFIGAIMLLNNGINGQKNISYSIYVIVATICYAFNINIIKKYLNETKPILISGLSFLLIGPISIIYLLQSSFIEKIDFSYEFNIAFGSIALLGIVGSAISIIIYNKLIQKSTAIFASSVTYIIPIFAMFWGIFDGETLNVIDVLWISVIIIGIYFVNLNENRIKKLWINKLIGNNRKQI